MQFAVVLSIFSKLHGSHVSIDKYFIRFINIKLQNKLVQRQNEKWKEKYLPILKQSNTISPKLCEEMREYMIALNNDTPPAENIILELLKDENCIDAGISFYNFIKSNKGDLPVYTVCKYMELYINKEGSLSTTERDHIYNICRNIMDTYETYDQYTASTLVHSLCKLDKWEEAIKVIKNYETYESCGAWAPYSFIIQYFLNHGHEKLGYEYLNHTFARGIIPRFEFNHSYFEYCLKEKDRFNERIEKLFELWCKYGVKPCKKTMLRCMEACSQAGWSAKFSSITNEKCSICNQNFASEDISDEGFEKLCRVIKDQLIFAKLYDVVEPREITRFVKYIQKRKPYDIVIDGLNLLYRYQPDGKVIKALKEAKANGLKILIVGRKHLLKFLHREQLASIADYFLVNDLSKDDLFLLYAAFSSKKNTKIISNDYMRNHEFKIKDPELKANFRKWQVLHQHTSLPTNEKEPDAKRVTDAAVQKHGNYWHIPYIEDAGMYAMRHTCDSHWVCINTCS